MISTSLIVRKTLKVCGSCPGRGTSPSSCLWRKTCKSQTIPLCKHFYFLIMLAYYIMIHGHQGWAHSFFLDLASVQENHHDLLSIATNKPCLVFTSQKQCRKHVGNATLETSFVNQCMHPIAKCTEWKKNRIAFALEEEAVRAFGANWHNKTFKRLTYRLLLRLKLLLRGDLCGGKYTRVKKKHRRIDLPQSCTPF